jgi:hypothetical protein
LSKQQSHFETPHLRPPSVPHDLDLIGPTSYYLKGVSATPPFKVKK